MIEKLVDILSYSELDLEAEDIADALWLASHLDQPDISTRITATLPKETQQETQPHFSDASRDISDARRQNAGKTKPLPTNDATAGSQAFLPSSQQGGKTTGGMTFRSPTASALPGALGIARALRPFKRGTPSNNQFILDEDATAERIAELGIWVPVFKPAITPWFEIALVIDEGASMVIWQQTVAELRFLLEHHGAFRNVKTWRLITDADDGKAEIAVGTGFDIHKRQIRRHGELLDPLSRRLILVVTDCVSPAWNNGEATRILTSWAEKTPVVIVQVLPQRLWSQTALSKAQPVRLRTSSFGALNTQLSAKITNRWIENDTLNELPMPIITLEAKAFSAWSRMLTGAAGITVPGFLLEQIHVPANKEYNQPAHILPNEGSSRLLSPEERLQHFQATASPLSRKLAQLLAAAPISLPVIRLIQHTMLSEASQVHIAEFFLSGLLEELPSQEAIAHPDDRQYEFIDGIRDMLLSSASMSDSIEVLKEVSDFIGDRFGQHFDFNALLAHPQGAIQVRLNEKSKPFAIIATKVLRRFGGKYAELAEEIEVITNALHADVPQVDIVQQKPLKTEEKKKPRNKPIRRSSLVSRLQPNLFPKIVCPSCFNEINVGDCRIISGRTYGKVLKGPSKNIFARINVEPLTGPFYATELAYRECPVCQYALPYNIERVPSITIAIVGDDSSGKSHYIASLLQQLRTEWITNSTFAKLQCLTSDVEQDYVRDYLEPLFSHRMALAATQLCASQYARPLIYNLATISSSRDSVTEANLMIHDRSGQDYEAMDRTVNFARFVLHANAFIFVVDPITIPAIFNQLDLNLKTPSLRAQFYATQQRRPVEGLNEILSTYRRYHGDSVGASLPNLPIAIMVSKSDLLHAPNLPNQANKYTFMQRPYYGGGIDLEDIEAVDQEVRELLIRYRQGDLMASMAQFERVSFFATSATGEPPDVNHNFTHVEPLRCLDPVLWCLYELGIIRANK